MIRSVILLSISVTLLLMAIRKMRQMKLKERYALTFIFIALPFWGLAIWPSAITGISTFLGISYFTVMLLAVSLFLILMVFELLVIVSVLDSKVSTLAQMIGIHHEKLQLTERSNANQETPPKLSLKREDDELGITPEVSAQNQAPPLDGLGEIVIKPLTISEDASADKPSKSSRHSIGE